MPEQSDLMFVGKNRILTLGKPKNFPEKNALAYSARASVTKKKKFYNVDTRNHSRIWWISQLQRPPFSSGWHVEGSAG